MKEDESNTKLRPTLSKELARKNVKKTCYFCGKTICLHKGVKVPIVESPKDIECPPKFDAHEACYESAAEKLY